MASVNGKPQVIPHVEAGVHIADLAPSELTSELEKLRDPWIAQEGPMSAELRRREAGQPLPELLMRGLAFDDATTVVWDEDAVRVIRETDPQEGVLSRRSDVRVRTARFEGLATVERIDYLKRGVLLASRYHAGGAADA